MRRRRISGLRFHDLQHTFATRLRAKGVHEMDIMTLLGHTTLQMTSRYTHAMPENLRTAVDSLTTAHEPSSRSGQRPYWLSRCALSADETSALPAARQNRANSLLGRKECDLC